MDPNIYNIVEDNVLESGEQASVIQEDATDNLEVGIPAVTIETVANDNVVVEGYSKELDFRNQPQLQHELQQIWGEHNRVQFTKLINTMKDCKGELSIICNEYNKQWFVLELESFLIRRINRRMRFEWRCSTLARRMDLAHRIELWKLSTRNLPGNGD